MSTRYSTSSSWWTLIKREEKALVDAECFDDLQVETFEQMKASLESMAREYGQHQVLSRLTPGLRYLDSFNNAISSASQIDPHACLVWGVMQALVKAAYQSRAVVSEMIELIAELNESLPEFESYMRMFPGSPTLQAHLQDMYTTYMEYCISAIKVMKSGTSRSLFNSFLGRSPVFELKRAKDEVQRHMRSFKRAARLSVTEQLMMHHINHELAYRPLKEPIQKPVHRTEVGVKFPINTVSISRNSAFLGRHKELLDIHSALIHSVKPIVDTAEPLAVPGDGNGVACCILQGLGGIGKTQTALEYTFRFGKDYDAIFWVCAELHSSIASAYANIAKQLGLFSASMSAEQERQGQGVELVKTWLSTTAKKWLIVFDNVENVDDVAIYVPSSIRSESATILTTQKNDCNQFAASTTIIKIKVLNTEEGGELIFKCLNRDAIDVDEMEHARQISDLLGGLPLALTTVGGFLQQTNDNLSKFYTDLKTSSNAWMASAVDPAKHQEKTLAMVFDIALKELTGDARDLIDVLAFLNPDRISKELLTSPIGNPRFPFLVSEPRLSHAIGRLSSRRLVERNPADEQQFLSIHRMVQTAVLHDLARIPEHRQKVYDRPFALIDAALPKVSSIDNPEPEAWPEFQKTLPHVLSIRNHCLWPKPPIKLNIEFAQVLSDMATFMWHAGLLPDAWDAMTTAESILDQHNVDIQHHLRGNIHSHFAIVASHHGVSFRELAMSRRYKAIEARQASHNLIRSQRDITFADEIRLWNVQSDLAYGFLQCERFDEAGELIEKCHEQYQKWGTPEDIPFEYLKYNHIISYTYLAQGRPLEAIKASKEGTRLGEVQAGPTHPMTLHVRCSMANQLYFAGMVEESLKENLIILQARSDVVGESNHFTLESHAMCAALYAELGVLDKADYHFSTCLDPHKSSIWDEECIARTRYLYASVLKRLNREEEATMLAAQANAVRLTYMAKYAKWLPNNTNNELAIFDQMCCLWNGRFTGKLTQKHKAHNPTPVVEDLEAVPDEVAADEPEFVGTIVEEDQTAVLDDGPAKSMRRDIMVSSAEVDVGTTARDAVAAVEGG